MEKSLEEATAITEGVDVALDGKVGGREGGREGRGERVSRSLRYVFLAINICLGTHTDNIQS